MFRLNSSIITAMLFFSPLTDASATEPSTGQIIWLDNVEQAIRQAKITKKPILIYFSGSDWCRPCMQLKDEVFASKAFNQYAAEKLILVQLDFPAQKKNKLPEDQQKHNAQMAEIHNPRGVFPLIVVLNSTDKKLGDMSGYQREGTGRYLAKLAALIDPI